MLKKSFFTLIISTVLIVAVIIGSSIYTLYSKKKLTVDARLKKYQVSNLINLINFGPLMTVAMMLSFTVSVKMAQSQKKYLLLTLKI